VCGAGGGRHGARQPGAQIQGGVMFMLRCSVLGVLLNVALIVVVALMDSVWLRRAGACRELPAGACTFPSTTKTSCKREQ
jgi:hypothetical protein